MTPSDTMDDPGRTLRQVAERIAYLSRTRPPLTAAEIADRAEEEITGLLRRIAEYNEPIMALLHDAGVNCVCDLQAWFARLASVERDLETMRGGMRPVCSYCGEHRYDAGWFPSSGKWECRDHAGCLGRGLHRNG